jgi:chromosome partitioning protein
VFSTIIRENVALAEAPAKGQTIFEYMPKSSGAEDYTALAEEVLNVQA